MKIYRSLITFNEIFQQFFIKFLINIFLIIFIVFSILFVLLIFYNTVTLRTIGVASLNLDILRIP